MDAVDCLEVTRGDQCVKTGTVKRHQAPIQAVQSTIQSTGSMCSTAVWPMGGTKVREGAAWLNLTKLNCYGGTVEYHTY